MSVLCLSFNLNFIIPPCFLHALERFTALFFCVNSTPSLLQFAANVAPLTRKQRPHTRVRSPISLAKIRFFRPKGQLLFLRPVSYFLFLLPNSVSTEGLVINVSTEATAPDTLDRQSAERGLSSGFEHSSRAGNAAGAEGRGAADEGERSTETGRGGRLADEPPLYRGQRL